MTLDEIYAAADRAANAAGRCSAKQGGWRADIGAACSATDAAEFVFRDPSSPAEALYLHLRRTARVAWGDLEPRKRVAVEVFRATVLVLRRLAIADIKAAPSPRGGYLRQQDEMSERTTFGLYDREVLR